MKLIFPLLFWPILLFAQNNIEGYVMASDNEPLAFVSVIAQSDARSVVFSDIDGHFNIPVSGVLQHLTFRYIGFTEIRLTAADIAAMKEKPLRVVLQSSNLALNTVDIVAGENPADILMRKVVANRHRNNPERNGAYTCKTYNKVSVDALPNRALFFKQEHKEKDIRSFEATEAEMKEHHLFFMESVTERSFLAPNFIQEKVLLNRVSGFKDAALVTLANAVQPFTFYGDFLPLMDKKFVNPVSPGSTKLYFFSLADTLFDGTDTIWVVQFKPRKGKIFMGLKGSLHIHSNQYAVQNVIAYPAFGNENLNMTIEQAYVFIPLPQDTLRGQWFPQQLNFELHAARYPSPVMGMKATGHSYISDASPNIQLSLKDFNPEQPLFIEKNAFTRDSLDWLNWQKNAALTSKEIKTYRHLDSLGAVKHFDQAAKAISALNTQVWPLYKGINLHLGSLLRLNEYEQIRLGLGFTNAQHRP